VIRKDAVAHAFIACHCVSAADPSSEAKSDRSSILKERAVVILFTLGLVHAVHCAKNQEKSRLEREFAQKRDGVSHEENFS